MLANKQSFWKKLPNIWGRWIAQVPVFHSTTFSPPRPINTSVTNTAINTQILCNNDISINNPVNITNIWFILDLRGRFYKTLKWATRVHKYIVLKIIYIQLFYTPSSKILFNRLANIYIVSWAFLAFFFELPIFIHLFYRSY